MSNKVADFLHELIHSLTKSEKRYFKLMSSRHTIGEENNYVILFDYIENQDVYDENELIKHFKGQAFLNKLSITKKRLYDHILSALDNFHAQSNIESQLFKMIHSADILCQKSLYSQAKKILLSAEKLAVKNELTQLLIHIRNKIKSLVEKNNYIDIQPGDLEEIVQNDLALLSQATENAKLWNLKSKLFQHMSFHGIARTDEEKKTYNDFYKLYESLKVNKKSNSESKYLSFHILSAYYFSIQNFDKSFHYLQENLKLFQENERIVKNHPDRYFSILSNLIYTAENLNQLGLAAEYFVELKRFESEIELNSSDEDLKLKLFTTLTSIELSTYTKKGEYHLAKENIARIETRLKIHIGKISPARKAFILYKIACIQLATGNAQLAQKTIRKILNDMDLDKKEDIVSFAHLLELFIHIELGDLDYLNYACRTAKRFLSSRKRMFQLEQELLSFAQKYGSIKNKFEAEERWTNLHTKLSNLVRDPYQASALEYFDFLSWAEAKSNNVDFAMLCKEKFNKGMLPAA